MLFVENDKPVQLSQVVKQDFASSIKPDYEMTKEESLVELNFK